MKRERQQDANILGGLVSEEDFARDNNVSKRTIAQYRKRPDGLPFTVWGGKVYIPVERAREYLATRTRHPNPVKRRT